MPAPHVLTSLPLKLQAVCLDHHRLCEAWELVKARFGSKVKNRAFRNAQRAREREDVRRALYKSAFQIGALVAQEESRLTHRYPNHDFRSLVRERADLSRAVIETAPRKSAPKGDSLARRIYGERENSQEHLSERARFQENTTAILTLLASVIALEHYEVARLAAKESAE